jgi:S1-C subfamily serine protease
MPFQDVVSKIKPAVVGMGLLQNPDDPLSVFIIGTGFFVHPSGWIMTNRHVAEKFVTVRDGKIGVRNTVARAVVFTDGAGRPIPGINERAVAGFGAIPCPIIETAMGLEAPDDDLHYDSLPDLALCRIDAQALKRHAPLQHIELGRSEGVREGDDVATCGFPLGLALDQSTRLKQMTPIVQRGIIAAVLPFGGLKNPHAFQLDIHINPGSSGSPLFRAETGDVIGIVFAAPQQSGEVVIPGIFEGDNLIGNVYLATGFGYAVPSSRYFEQPNPTRRLPDVFHRPE